MKLVAFLTLLCLLAVNAEELQGPQLSQCRNRYYNKDWYKVGSYCVKFFHEYLDFISARTRCQKTGNQRSELLSIHNSYSNGLVINFPHNGYKGLSWIGGVLQGASWVWTDGTQFDYDKVVSGPNKSDQQCIAIAENGSWVPIKCTEELAFYCSFWDK